MSKNDIVYDGVKAMCFSVDTSESYSMHGNTFDSQDVTKRHTKTVNALKMA